MSRNWISCYHLAAAVAVAAAAWSSPAIGTQPPEQDSNRFFGGDVKFSLPKPSLDGVIRWTDQYFFHQWRIQQHVDTGECRLLDEAGESRAEGTFDECLAALQAMQREQNLRPMDGKAVVLMHGLAAPCWSMKLLARHLRKHGGYEVFPVDYSSLRSNIDQQAASLARVIASLEGIDEINLVGHSMGNIVIRRYLAGDQTPQRGWHPDPRVHRVVMIAPPNHGSVMASRLSDNSLFKAVFGQSGRQLGAEWEDLESRLATPPGEFGIIAGGWKNPLGLDPFLPGDDDGRITVETTRLAGATDFVVVPALHELIANDPRVFRYTLRFLNDGCFVAPDRRHGIPGDGAAVIAEGERPVRR
jgi:pimeloyl-ACP methyl ester carboxylesterase